MKYDLSNLIEATRGCDPYDPSCFNKECPTHMIPNYGMDHNYSDSAEQGEDSATNYKNYPAIASARTSGGTTHPQTISNGINATARNKMDLKDINPKFRSIVNDREEDAYQQESVCDVLSGFGYPY